MTNGEFVDDKKIKDILTYISGMKHAEQIRMMFLCSLNGMRSINFAYLQVKDVFTDNFKIKDVICLDYDKNKGKNKCSYYMNSQLKKEFCEYLKYLQRKWKDRLTPETYLFTSQKLNKPYISQVRNAEFHKELHEREAQLAKEKENELSLIKTQAKMEQEQSVYALKQEIERLKAEITTVAKDIPKCMLCLHLELLLNLNINMKIALKNIH